MFTSNAPLIGTVARIVDAMDCAPWGAAAGRCVGRGTAADCDGHGNSHAGHHAADPAPRYAPRLYTIEERRRRDASPWTFVQGVLAPAQFGVFVVSLGFVLHYLLTGHGLMAATASIVVKTLTLYTIMITGSIWEKDVFGRYLFARAFFWEDVFSMLVLALHTAYLVALFTGALDAEHQMLLALAAYASYVVNAAQFVLKLRAARLEQARWPTAPVAVIGSSR